MNIGYTDASDWLKYKISVSESGEYQLTTRYAGTAAGKFDILIDDVKKISVNTTNTNSWQTWASVTNSIYLSAGEHMLKLVVITKGFNLNWLNFSKGSAGISDLSLQRLHADIYPNPITGKRFKIVFQNHSFQNLTVLITDLTGKTLFTKEYETLNAQEIEIDLGNMPDISKGIYTLSVRSKQGFLNKKIALF